MSAGNAFAMNANQGLGHGSHSEEHCKEPPHKKLRPLETATPAINWQCAKEETSLDVDILILEYLAHHSTKKCLSSRTPGNYGDSRSLCRSLALANDFLTIFKSRHPKYNAEPDLRFRIKLLRFATLFTQRLTRNSTTPDLINLRTLRMSCQKRAQAWIEQEDRRPSRSLTFAHLDRDLPIAQQKLEQNRARILRDLRISAEDDAYEDSFYGTSACVSLIEILPIFMELAAARKAMIESNLKELWMQLACRFMLHACLEQYLAFGAHGSGAIDEAFAWGYKEVLDGRDLRSVYGDDGVSASELHDMFEDEGQATEVDGWKEMRSAFLSELQPGKYPQAEHNHDDDQVSEATILNTQVSLESHFLAVAMKHPVAEFEAELTKFLNALLNSVAAPVLVQLETGNLDGMSAEQTWSFLREFGISD